MACELTQRYQTDVGYAKVGVGNRCAADHQHAVTRGLYHAGRQRIGRTGHHVACSGRQCLAESFVEIGLARVVAHLLSFGVYVWP